MANKKKKKATSHRKSQTKKAQSLASQKQAMGNNPAPATAQGLMACPNEILEAIMDEVFKLGKHVVDNFAEDTTAENLVDCTNSDLLSFRLASRRINELAAIKYKSKVAVVNVSRVMDKTRKTYPWIESLKRLANSNEAHHVTHLYFNIYRRSDEFWPIIHQTDNAKILSRDDETQFGRMASRLLSRFSKAHALIIKSPDLNPLLDPLAIRDNFFSGGLCCTLVESLANHRLRSIDIECDMSHLFGYDRPVSWHATSKPRLQDKLRNVTKLRTIWLPSGFFTEERLKVPGFAPFPMLLKKPVRLDSLVVDNPGLILNASKATDWSQGLKVQHLQRIDVSCDGLRALLQRHAASLRSFDLSDICVKESSVPLQKGFKDIGFPQLQSLGLMIFNDKCGMLNWAWWARTPGSAQQWAKWVRSNGWKGWNMSKITFHPLEDDASNVTAGQQMQSEEAHEPQSQPDHVEEEESEPEQDFEEQEVGNTEDDVYFSDAGEGRQSASPENLPWFDYLGRGSAQE